MTEKQVRLAREFEQIEDSAESGLASAIRRGRTLAERDSDAATSWRRAILQISFTLHAPRERVWKALTTRETIHKINTALGIIEWRAEPEMSEPSQRLTLRRHGRIGNAVVTYHLVGLQGSRTRVDVEEIWEAPDRALSWFARRIFPPDKSRQILEKAANEIA